MKNYVAIASLALVVAAPAAFAQEEVQGTQDCASLQSQYDQAAAAATAEVGTVLELASTTTPVRRSGTSTSLVPNPGSAPLWLSVLCPR